MTKYFGDLSEEQISLSKELENFEHLVDKENYLAEKKAQIYVCLAHDWYKLEMEEEGDRLLLKAEKVCPGYFKNTIIKHQKEDKDFDTVVTSITKELIALFANKSRNRT